jgi:hypothetical protein
LIVITPKISAYKALFLDMLQTVTGFHPYLEHTPKRALLVMEGKKREGQHDRNTMWAVDILMSWSF